MKLSARVEYGCLAMMHLAARFAAGGPVSTGDIADTYGISPRFLVQVLTQLKAAGLVVSERGVAGGYLLAREPDTITLAEVVDVIDGRDGDGNKPATESPGHRVLRDVWNEASAAQRGCLQAVHLAELVRRAGEGGTNMYYI